MARCSACGYENQTDVRYCNQCGVPLAVQSSDAAIPERKAEIGPAPATYKVIGIVGIVLGALGSFQYYSLVGLICAIVGVTQASKAEKQWMAGDRPRCESTASTARALNLIGAALGAVMLIVRIIGAVVQGTMNSGLFHGFPWF